MKPAAAALSRVLTTALTGPARREAKRRMARISRALRRAPATVHYFHQADDPYGHLAVQCLSPLVRRYRIAIRCHLVPPPAEAAAPERELLAGWGRRDAARVARRYGLHFPERAPAPGTGAVHAANAALAAALEAGTFAADAVAVGQRLWQGQAQPGPDRAAGAGARRALREGGELRGKLGHYLGGMFHFEGEWYWGVDRLHHLETRLRQENLVVGDPAAVAPVQDMRLDGRARAGERPVIELWFSFRSPYSWIALPRMRRLAGHYGAQLRLRYILPMVMRGLPVPRAKRRYIMFDVKREAERVGLPFGTVVDPVGRGVERALAVLEHAIAAGRGIEFAESGLRAAFADGIDLSSDRGLERAAARAGLSDEQVRSALADEGWRVVAEDNRRALFDAGLWGAPTFRVDGGSAYWGQDRLWALEEDLVQTQRGGP